MTRPVEIDWALNSMRSTRWWAMQTLREYITKLEAKLEASASTGPVSKIVNDILIEQRNQVIKWGEQHHLDGTHPWVYSTTAEEAKERTEMCMKMGVLTWRDILLEEVWEALAEDAREGIRAELVQVAAVCVSWIKDIDSRAS